MKKIIAVPKESTSNEKRVALLPSFIPKLKKLGFEVLVEKTLGESLYLADDEYLSAGATILESRKELLEKSDIVLRVKKPSSEEISYLKKDSIHISFLDPFKEKPLIQELAHRGVSTICFELMPRTTLAQKMDALSSQANIAGYSAVLTAADHLQKILPMMTTPAGTLLPAQVFVVGVGVAGLQAIATAKRLGAKVVAFDTRAVTEEQVKSLGAKFVKIDLGETGQTKDGYAKPLTEAQIEKQKMALASVCQESDIVITTAQVLGRKAPVIITDFMIQKMRKGSVIVDLAIENGGNVENAKMDQMVVHHGVTIMGCSQLPSKVAYSASHMYAANMTNLIEHFFDKTLGTLKLDPKNEILSSALLTHDGKILQER